MKVVLADIEKDALEKAEKELLDMETSVLAVKTDVSKEEDVKRLAEKALKIWPRRPAFE